MCVSVLWGITNPLMGKGSMGICDVKHGNILAQFLAELKFLLLNWKVCGIPNITKIPLY